MLSLANLTDALLFDELSDADIAPTRHVIDYFEIGFFIVLMVVGIPINLRAAYTLWAEFLAIRHHQLPAEISQLPYLLFKMNLNIADLLILTVFSPTYTGWLITYEWIGGNIACKILHVVFVFIFCLSSCLIMCIAVDRLFGVRSMDKPMGGAGHRLKFTKIALAVVYAFSVLVSIPQFFIFKVVTPIPSLSQCVTMWDERRLVQTLQTGQREFYLFTVEFIYEVCHIVAIFWLPTCITWVCYTMILRNLYKYSGRRATLGTLDTLETGTVHNECNETCPITQHRDRATSMPVEQSTEFNMIERQRIGSDVGPLLLHPNTASYMCTPRAGTPVATSLMTGSTVTFGTSLPPSDTQSLSSILNVENDDRRRSSTISGCMLEWKSNFRHKLIKKLVPVVIGHLLCWTPYNCVSILSLIMGAEHSNLMHVMHSLQSLVALNALVDPFLYGAFEKANNNHSHK